MVGISEQNRVTMYGYMQCIRDDGDEGFQRMSIRRPLNTLTVHFDYYSSVQMRLTFTTSHAVHRMITPVAVAIF